MRASGYLCPGIVETKLTVYIAAPGENGSRGRQRKAMHFSSDRLSDLQMVKGSHRDERIAV
jgi:hypothetical protein